jgi:hypothetical protein
LDIFKNFAPRAFIYNDYALGLLEGFKLPHKCRKLIDQYFDKNKMINARDFDTSLMPIKLGSLQQRRVKEACAIAAYRTQTAIPIIATLISDHAPQFKLLTETLWLCWVHEGRHYKKLNTIITDNKRILDEFLTQY